MSKEAKELQTAVATGAVTLGLAALAAPSAAAATFTVTNLNDSGAGSLRDAVASANTTAGADVITFQPGLTGTILLTTGELSLYDAVDIQGPGAATITVSGNNASRIFYIYSAANAPIDVTISGLTVTNGSDVDGGGAIIDWGENLTLDHVVVSNSTTDGSGGGVSKEAASGTLHILELHHQRQFGEARRRRLFLPKRRAGRHPGLRDLQQHGVDERRRHLLLFDRRRRHDLPHDHQRQSLRLLRRRHLSVRHRRRHADDRPHHDQRQHRDVRGRRDLSLRSR
jgi:hypothetical protein